MIEVVYRVIKTKQFKTKDALKKAKAFTKQISKKRSTDEVQLFNIRGTTKHGSTNGYWEYNWKTEKFRWCELDG